MICVQQYSARLIHLSLILLALSRAAPSFGAASAGWKLLTTADGLPSNRVLCLAADSNTIWAGTDDGLVLMQNGKIKKIFTSKDGLAGNVVTSLAVDANTGDLWVAMFGGISRISAGTVQSFTVLDSGLANDVVYDIAVQGRFVWAATASGLSRFDNRSKTWTIYDDRNSPMADPWPVRIVVTKEAVFVGSWGGGVSRLDIATERWTVLSHTPEWGGGISLHGREHAPRFVRGLAFNERSGSLWFASQNGLAWYRSESSKTSKEFLSLPGTINSIRIADGQLWVCTDEGLKAYDLMQFKSGFRSVGPFSIHTRSNSKPNEVTRRRIIPELQVFDVALQGSRIWVASAAGLWQGGAGSASKDPRSGAKDRTPGQHQNSRDKPMGTYREANDSQRPTTVNIGLLAPLENSPDVPFGMAMLHGAELALEEANARNGPDSGTVGGRWHYILKSHNDSAQWGAGTMEPVRMAQEEKVVAVLGSFDGMPTHTLLRISEELGILVINTATTDPSIKDTGTPWLVTLAPDDRQQSTLLAENIVGQKEIRKLGIIRENARYALIGIQTFVQTFRGLTTDPTVQETFQPGTTDFSEQLTRLKDANINALVIWCQPDEGALILKQMQAIGLRVPAFGPSNLASPLLISLTGPASEGLVVVNAFDSSRIGKKAREFEKRFRERFGEPPDAYAAYAYDGMDLLIAAIDQAGPESSAVTNAISVSKRQPLDGVTGNVILNDSLNSTPHLLLSRVVQGRFVSWSSVLAR